MRRTRRLILLVIVVILAVVGYVYNARKTAQARNTPSKPASLPDGVGSRANQGWTHSEVRNGIPAYEVKADNYRLSADGSHAELGGVVLRLFTKDGKNFDEVKSAKADYDTNNGLLVSEGEVEITRGVQTVAVEESKQSGKLMVIKTSGVSYESKSGKVWTEKPASFRFDRGEGQSTGAEYDPNARELHMRKNVQLKWFDSAKPMEIEAGALVYKEADSQVWLLEWSKFKRATLSMQAGPATIRLENGAIRAVEAVAARGVDAQKERKVEYSADRLDLKFTPKGVVEDVIGDGNAKLVSTATTTQTTVTSNRLDLDFQLAGEEAKLKKATANGNAVVESRPILQPKVTPPDTRYLRSEVIAMYMRPGGEEIERVQAEARGTVDFMPNRPGQKKRHMEGDGITLEYGPENQVRSFTATNVTTRTESEAPKGKPVPPPAITSSKGMAAKFDPKTGAMSQLEQWDDFKYQEGDRQAKADRAVLDQGTDKITLTGLARVWDPTGSTAANTIAMTQTSGDVQADGNVTSTRMPDKKKGPAGAAPTPAGMLASDEPLQAKAARMTTIGDNKVIHYEGNALMWQGSNRIQADRIDIDRNTGVLQARGNVTTQLLDKSETQKQKKGAVFTVVKSPEMIYRDKERLAHYTGGVVLTRGSMVMNSKELRAFLEEEAKGGGSSLHHAFADGGVKIVDVTPVRTRTGTSEHAEYYVAEAKVVLNGGEPQLVDTVKGTTRGRQLTFFSDTDKLTVEGAQEQPVKSRILKK
ncbi:MAG TPA: LPS export ABC transporter periplasmic protein LptC [Bryobacteraceae bacterium]|nr:LPS export ABC transporter periplasmic protein LptC [Bryobacteraceae bacterium]